MYKPLQVVETIEVLHSDMLDVDVFDFGKPNQKDLEDRTRKFKYKIVCYFKQSLASEEDHKAWMYVSLDDAKTSEEAKKFAVEYALKLCKDWRDDFQGVVDALQKKANLMDVE